MANVDVVVRETGRQRWSGLRTSIMIHSHRFHRPSIVFMPPLDDIQMTIFVRILTCHIFPSVLYHVLYR
jgi:hypothetical protein